ncbi:MAG TPA: alpha/beta hydrolase, partial [Fibrobacteraceae bacterium]|nr:alpha/beta hydrolase [Fibrobacteraceae bacterium]
ISPIHYEFAEEMNGYGYAVFAIDYRNPSRRFLDEKWTDDIEIGIDHIMKNPAVDTGNVYLAGFSMGGTNAVRYLPRSKGIKGLVCYASPMRFDKPGLLKLIGEGNMPIRISGSIHVPVLFFQGLDDSITKPWQSEEFIDSLRAHGKDVEYVGYVNTKHGFTYKGVNNERVGYNRESAFDSYTKVHEFIESHSHQPKPESSVDE